MSGNRSLDEFGAEEPADGEPGNATEAAASPEADPAASEDGIEPIAETFAWSASGAACEVCGESVTTRWRDGGTLVCEECKAW